MKRTLLSFLTLVGISVSLYAQEVQWASKVLEFSSELTPVQYSAQQVLGKPNVLPAGGQSPNAWAPDKPKRKLVPQSEDIANSSGYVVECAEIFQKQCLAFGDRREGRGVDERTEVVLKERLI